MGARLLAEGGEQTARLGCERSGGLIGATIATLVVLAAISPCGNPGTIAFPPRSIRTDPESSYSWESEARGSQAQ